MANDTGLRLVKAIEANACGPAVPILEELRIFGNLMVPNYTGTHTQLREKLFDLIGNNLLHEHYARWFCLELALEKLDESDVKLIEDVEGYLGLTKGHFGGNLHNAYVAISQSL